MANLYIHFPFCKQACLYFIFHFSTSTSNRTILWEAIVKEYEMRKNEILLPLESIYLVGAHHLYFHLIYLLILFKK